MPQTLTALPGEYAIAQLPPDAPVPTWALAGGFFSLTRTEGELSVVLEADRVPAGVRAERGWALLQLRGPFDFALTGVLSSVLAPLAQAGVGIFALSTFDTDYLLVKAAQLPDAVTALRGAGHTVHP